MLELLPTPKKTGEVFVEIVTREGNRGLFRRRLICDKSGFPAGVRTEVLSTFHARIISVGTDGDGPDPSRGDVLFYTVALKSGQDARLIEMPPRAFDGSAAGDRLFLKHVYRAGIAGAFAFDGYGAATVRACISLSRARVLMP